MCNEERTFLVKQTQTAIESMIKENGQDFWDAREVSDFLEYKSYDSFRNVISRAMTLASKVLENTMDEFQPVREEDGKENYRLSRFAFLLCLQNADRKKERVSLSLLYLSAYHSELLKRLERLDKREELKESEKGMVEAAFNKGVTDSQDIARFKNSGYRGLYNMNLNKLKKHKSLPQGNHILYDFMDSLELSANNFRVQLTKSRIDGREEETLTSTEVSKIAETAGKNVRTAILSEGGTPPEDLKLSQEKINQAKIIARKEGKQLNKKSKNK